MLIEMPARLTRNGASSLISRNESLRLIRRELLAIKHILGEVSKVNSATFCAMRWSYDQLLAVPRQHERLFQQLCQIH